MPAFLKQLAHKCHDSALNSQVAMSLLVLNIGCTSYAFRVSAFSSRVDFLCLAAKKRHFEAILTNKRARTKSSSLFDTLHCDPANQIVFVSKTGALQPSQHHVVCTHTPRPHLDTEPHRPHSYMHSYVSPYVRVSAAMRTYSVIGKILHLRVLYSSKCVKPMLSICLQC